jgi:hypothetical protein
MGAGVNICWHKKTKDRWSAPKSNGLLGLPKDNAVEESDGKPVFVDRREFQAKSRVGHHRIGMYQTRKACAMAQSEADLLPDRQNARTGVGRLSIKSRKAAASVGPA